MTATTENRLTMERDLSGADIDAWHMAYEEARGRGAGESVARFYADQRVLYLRRDRDGVAIPGTHDYQAYR